jgi:hypothetical protein
MLKSTDGGTAWIPVGPAGDTINAVALDPVNSETAFCGVNGGRDGFVCTFTPEGQIDSCSYLGGTGADQCNAVALEGLTTVCVAGSTVSRDFPVTTGPPAVQSTNPVTQSAPIVVRSEYITTKAGLFVRCVEDSTVEKPIILNGGQSTAFNLSTCARNTAISTTGLPPGLDIAVATSGYLYGDALELHGLVPPTPGSYVVTLHLDSFFDNPTPHHCTYNITFTIIIH